MVIGPGSSRSWSRPTFNDNMKMIMEIIADSGKIILTMDAWWFHMTKSQPALVKFEDTPCNRVLYGTQFHCGATIMHLRNATIHAVLTHRDRIKSVNVPDNAHFDLTTTQMSNVAATRLAVVPCLGDVSSAPSHTIMTTLRSISTIARRGRATSHAHS